MEYFEVEVPFGDALCSDDECPCRPPDDRIPRGSGYLYISETVVNFRQDACTIEEAKQKIARTNFYGQNRHVPTLMCQQGARKRGLDLNIAAADAKHWWETGLVPLRATPLAGSAVSQKEHAKSAGKSPVNRILAMAVVGNGFIPSDGIVKELLHGFYQPGAIHPQAVIKTQKGAWTNDQEKIRTSAVWVMGFFQYPIVLSTFGSWEEGLDYVAQRDVQTDQGDCLIIELHEKSG